MARSSEDPSRARAVAERLLERALAGEQRTAGLELRGACMEPLAGDGAWAEVVPAAWPPAPGGLALARGEGGTLVCHRVLASSDEGCWLAGDRSLAAAWHRRPEVLGRVRRLRRDGAERRLAHPPPAADRLLAALHWRSFTLRGTLRGRLLEALRLRLLAVRAVGTFGRLHRATVTKAR